MSVLTFCIAAQFLVLVLTECIGRFLIYTSVHWHLELPMSTNCVLPRSRCGHGHTVTGPRENDIVIVAVLSHLLFEI